MPDEWRIATLGDVTKWTSGGTPRKGEQRFWNGNIPWISAVSMKTSRLADSELQITEEGLQNGGHLAETGSVLILVRGSELHKRIPIGISTRPVAFNQDVKALRSREGLTPEFLLYWLLANEPILLGKVEHTGIGAGKLDTEVLKSMPLRLPPLPVQRAIAYILGTLDDKIELNRRRSRTLEEMARALFKSWFVDFDPVRAKMEGRWRKGQSLPGLPAHLYDLFPDRLVDSELGEITEGWEPTPLPDLIDVNPSRSLRKGEIAPYLDMANMPTHSHAPDEVIERPFGSGMRFINGDTLLARITPCLENGKTAFVDFLLEGQVGWGSTEYIVLTPKPPLPPEFAYCLARSAEFREFAIQSMTGTSGRQRVQADSLAHFKLPHAPKLVAEAFGLAVKPLFARSSGAIHESRALAALRDALLPRLISGELWPSKAEHFPRKANTG